MRRHTPYGFAYFDGQLVIDPKEQIVIRKILKLRQSGLSLRAIAVELNRQKTPPRSGKIWHLTFVKTILERPIKIPKIKTPKNIS